MKEKRLVVKQLDKSLQQLLPLSRIIPPRKGWIQVIRNALGMKARQLAVRVGVSQQRIAQIEKQELNGSLTIKSMRRVAEAIDCQFVYGFVPNNTLEKTIYNQSKQLSLRRIAQASHTMALEGQALTKEENTDILSEMIEDLINELPPSLWDNK